MFRVGIVKAQDLRSARVRVIFPDRNQMISWWLPVVTPKSQDDKAYWMPDPGEQVVCLMDEHDEDGAVLGSIYSSMDMAPVSSADKWHLAIKDGATFEYDRSSHSLAVNLPSTGTMSISANGATIDVDASGNITLRAAGDITLITPSHSDSVNGIINTYNSHTHPDAQGSNTGAPNQTMG
jgi:phage baseplate assembly protein V